MRLTVLAVGAAFGVAALALADESATINIAGVQIRNNRNESRDSGADTIDPATRYRVTFSDDTRAHGVGGVLGLLYPNPTSLRDILEGLSPGSSAMLTQIVDNPSGTHPFAGEPITQSGEVVQFGVTFTFAMTLTTGIRADNVAFFSLTNVVLQSSSPLLPPGYLLFDSGSVTIRGYCPADFNGSGGTPDDADIAAFFNAWNNGDESADINLSGGTPDDADVSYFFQRWNEGC